MPGAGTMIVAVFLTFEGFMAVSFRYEDSLGSCRACPATPMEGVDVESLWNEGWGRRGYHNPLPSSILRKKSGISTRV